MTPSSRCHYVVSSKQKAGKACTAKQEHQKMFSALTNWTCAYGGSYIVNKNTVISYFFTPFLQIYSNHIFKPCKNKMKNLKMPNYIYIRSVCLSSQLGISLFPYVIHMGLSSILLKFDTAEMERSLCFLINKKPLNFFKQRDNISQISGLWELLLFR